MARADLVREELERCGIEYLVWLPDSETRSFYDTIMKSPTIKLVQVCHEEEAVGVHAGLWLGGKRSAVLIQNSGLLHSLDALRAFTMDMRIPTLLLVGYRGYHGMLEGKKPVDTAAVVLEPVLDALGIKHYLFDTDEEVENIGKAYREALAEEKATAVLIGREYD